jgi:hypothetical protein
MASLASLISNNNSVPSVAIDPDVIKYVFDRIEIKISINNDNLKFILKLGDDNYESTEVQITDGIYKNKNICHYGEFHAVKQYFIKDKDKIPDGFCGTDKYFHTFIFNFMKMIYMMDNTICRTVDARINTRDMPKFHGLPKITYQLNPTRLIVKLVRPINGEFIGIEKGVPIYGPPIGEEIIDIISILKKI